MDEMENRAPPSHHTHLWERSLDQARNVILVIAEGTEAVRDLHRVHESSDDIRNYGAGVVCLGICDVSAKSTRSLEMPVGTHRCWKRLVVLSGSASGQKARKLRLINDTGKLEHARSRDDDGKSMWDNRKRFVVVVGVVLLDHSSNRVREAMAEMYPCVAESDAWVREKEWS